MPEGYVDLVVTSPPYPGADMWQRGEDDLTQLNLAGLREATRMVRENGVICWQVADIPNGNHGIVTTATTTILAAKELGLKMRAQIVWNKASSNLVPICFMRRPVIPSLTHEFILVFFKGDWIPREKSSGLQGDKRWLTQSVWQIAPVRDNDHPAPFPLELARRCISFWSLENERVLDPFMGIGTTGLACIKMCRDFVGIELNPVYFSEARRRIEEAQLQMPLLPNYGMKPMPQQLTFEDGLK